MDTEKRYKLEFTEKAMKQLHKLDKKKFMLIMNWLAKNLENCENPRLHGRALVGNHAGKWRYRIGDYRLLAKIDDDRIVILILEAGHRKEIYE